MRIAALYVYPLKGAAAVLPAAASLDSFGLQHDRRWMVVRADGEFITQRNHPRLGHVRTELEADALVLRSEPAGELRLPLALQQGARTRVRVWADDVEAIDAGAEAAAFMEAHLGFAARLVFMPDSTLRQAHLDHAQPGDRVSFADGFPLLLITQESLDAVNARLAEPIEMIRFRPNVVVAGATPHAEDTWRRIRMGAVECDVVKPCARCVVTTLDPATLLPGREPLRTLAGYRRWDGHVWFGQNVIHRATGTLRVGDPVAVLESGPARPPIDPPVAGP